MAQTKRKKLTNKEIETGFNNIVADLGRVIKRVVAVDSIFADYVEMKGEHEQLREYINKKYVPEKEKDEGTADKK